MTFAKRVFLGAGIWGVVVLTPLYFLFDAIVKYSKVPFHESADKSVFAINDSDRHGYQFG